MGQPKRSKTLTRLLREGYEEMAAETRRIMQDFEKLDRDSALRMTRDVRLLRPRSAETSAERGVAKTEVL